jgi:hypothetical protein
VRRILIVSPESELERGEIYFLIPASSVPERKKKTTSHGGAPGGQNGKTSSHAKSKASSDHASGRPHVGEVPSEKRSLHRRRTSTGGRAAVWRPHLECIVEGT